MRDGVDRRGNRRPHTTGASERTAERTLWTGTAGVEAVTSHGPVDAKRHDELRALFSASTVGLVFVTAFLDRRTLAKFVGDISWETEVWVAESPTHLIHFNGDRFLGPHA
jgi:hypothetical protein